MLADDVADRLQTAGVGTKGVDLFKIMDPGRPDTAVIVYATQGVAPMDAMGSRAVVVEQPTVHVLIRGATGALAEAKANAVLRALHKFSGTINTTRYLFIRALQSPFDVGPDEKGRPRYVVNFRAVKELTT